MATADRPISDAQRSSYRESGYLLVKCFFEAAEVAPETASGTAAASLPKGEKRVHKVAKGEIASVPCKVVRNREVFTFESDPIGVSMTMVMAQVLDQFDQMIVTREEKMVIERGYSVTLAFEAAAV